MLIPKRKLEGGDVEVGLIIDNAIVEATQGTDLLENYIKANYTYKYRLKIPVGTDMYD